MSIALLPTKPQDYRHSRPALNHASDYQGPELVIDLNAVTQQVSAFHKALPQVQPHYAVKANPHPEVLRHLHKLGVNFEIASEGELRLLQDIGVKGQDIIFSNPIKTPNSIREAADYGVQWFAVDCLEELKSLELNAPNGFYELRLPTDGHGSVWPLSTKFGTTDDTLTPILTYAAQNGLNLAGVTFHVGSQCTQATSWVKAIDRATQVMAQMRKLGLTPHLLNIGGGFPTQVSRDTPSIGELAKSLAPALASLEPNLRLVAEPGRFMVGSAGTLHCQVINTTERHGQRWAYLDCGYYNGLIEMSSNFGFQLHSQRQGPLTDWVIAGPTCDSIDTFDPLYRLPQNTLAGDRLSIANVGAYSNACACDFNGFDVPRVRINEATEHPKQA
ncbi:MAG: type III PLP-dependent enzyme [Cellvibrionaceae bacterium]